MWSDRIYSNSRLSGTLTTWSYSFSFVCVCVHSFNHVQLFATLWTVALQASLSIGFPRQEYWNGLPCLPPGDICDPGIEPLFPVSPALWLDSLLLNHCGSYLYHWKSCQAHRTEQEWYKELSCTRHAEILFEFCHLSQ